MSFTPERCEVCHKQDAALYMVVRQDKEGGGERVAKGHVCLDCFERMQEGPVVVEAVSLQEWRDVAER